MASRHHNYLEAVQRLLQSCEAQRAIVEQREASTVSTWLESAERRATEERELRRLLELLGASVLDAVRAGELQIAAPLQGATVAKEPPPKAVKKEPAPTSTAVSQPQPKAAPVPITEETLNKLQASLRGGGDKIIATPSNGVSEATKKIASKALNTLGTTPARVKGKQFQQELKRVSSVIEQQLRHWDAAGTEVNHDLTSWVAARLRGLQDDAAGKPKITQEVGRLIGVLGGHSKTTRPGIVNGLALVHRPRGKTWWDDASEHEATLRALCGMNAQPTFNKDDALRKLTNEIGGLTSPTVVRRVRDLCEQGVSPQDTRLVRLCIPFLEDLRLAKQKELVAAIEEELADEQTADATTRMPPDWPHFDVTEGKVAVIVGGEPRPERRARLQEAFRFESLDWLSNPTGAGREVDSLVRKMKNGTVDIVIVLRAYISHKVSDKLFAKKNASCLLVQADSYGLNQVRLGIERFT